MTTETDLAQALRAFRQAKTWVASDSYDGIDPRGRELLEEADVLADAALAAHDRQREEGEARASDSTLEEWLKRHDLRGVLVGKDARAAFDDAASLSAPPASHPPGTPMAEARRAVTDEDVERAMDASCWFRPGREPPTAFDRGAMHRALESFAGGARTASRVQTAATSEALWALVAKWRYAAPYNELFVKTVIEACADELAAALGPQPVDDA